MYCAFVCHSMPHVAILNSPESGLAAIPSTTVYPVLSVMLFRFFLDCSCAISLCYPCVHLPTLCFLSLLSPFIIVYPVPLISATPLYNCLPCAISLCHPRLHVSTLCYQTLLSPFTTVYPVLSVSAIPLSIVYHMLSVSAIRLYYCLPCAFYLCHL